MVEFTVIQYLRSCANKKKRNTYHALINQNTQRKIEKKVYFYFTGWGGNMDK